MSSTDDLEDVPVEGHLAGSGPVGLAGFIETFGATK